jgi:ABC-type methionine transport system ATPase subunit
MFDLMVQLARDGMTMMVVTHEMGFERKVSHRVMFMDGGRIVDDGATAAFFGDPMARSARAREFLSKVLPHSPSAAAHAADPPLSSIAAGPPLGSTAAAVPLRARSRRRPAARRRRRCR